MNDPQQPSFAKVYCDEFKCSTETFELSLLRRVFGLPTPLNRLANCLTRIFPRFYEIDILALKRIGATRSRIEFENETNDLFYLQRRDRGFIARGFPICVSVEKLSRLVTLLPKQKSAFE